MQRLTRCCAIIGAPIFATACGTTKIVFVDTSADIVRIGPGGAVGKVYVRKGGEWILGKNRVRLPEGWYAGGLPKETENE